MSARRSIVGGPGTARGGTNPVAAGMEDKKVDGVAEARAAYEGDNEDQENENSESQHLQKRLVQMQYLE